MVKQAKKLLVGVVLCFIFSGNGNVFAMEEGFVTEEMSQNEYERFYDNLNITMFTEEPPKDGIECFDVNDEGMVAIGINRSGHSREQLDMKNIT